MSDEKPTSQKKLIAGLVTICCLSLLATGAFFVVRQQAANKYKDQFASKIGDPGAQPGLREERIARAKVIREKWKPWAQKNKALLQRMLKASPNDSKIAFEVYTKIPGSTVGPKAVVMNTDLQSGSTEFSWQAVENFLVAPNAPKSRDRDFAVSEIKKDFAKNQDVSLSQSINPGLLHMNVWATGRITEEGLKELPRVPGKPVLGESEPIEIVPPYDFLEQ